jgi:hypothetical protein
MSQFPNSIDDNSTLPIVNNNIAENGSDAINSVRDATIAIETNIGIGAAGNLGSIANRLSGVIDADGHLIPVPGMIPADNTVTDAKINSSKISEYNLNLDFSTLTLQSNINALGNQVTSNTYWINSNGAFILAHLIDTNSSKKHELNHIFLSTSQQSSYVTAWGTPLTTGTPSLNDLLTSINGYYNHHQKADGSESGLPTIHTISGKVYQSSFAHHAAGIYVDSANFHSLNTQNNDLQTIIEELDTIYNTKVIENSFSSGISTKTRQTNFESTNDHYGFNDVSFDSSKSASYVCTTNLNPTPTFDDFTTGDDVIKVTISTSDFSGDSNIGNVKLGDIASISYTTNSVTTRVQYYIIGKRKDPSTRDYYFRLSAKNFAKTQPGTTASVFFSKPLFKFDTSGILNISAVQSSDVTIPPSIIVANPTGAFVLGQDFNPYQFDTTHYNLYLALFPYFGNTTTFKIVAIDVTGNLGQTPGLYTIDSIVSNMNNQFRLGKYRFVAFKYNGNVGIMLADSYEGASFAIIGGTLNSSGVWSEYGVGNVVSMVQNGSIAPIDPFGFGDRKANIASPELGWTTSDSNIAYQNPLKLFTPHRNQYYHVNGKDLETLSSFNSQIPETQTQPPGTNNVYNGVGHYWESTVLEQFYIASKLHTVYRIYMEDLSQTTLAKGKTIVVLPKVPTYTTTPTYPTYDFNYGRFVITDINCNNCATPYYYDITVADAKCIYSGDSTSSPSPTYVTLATTTDTTLLSHPLVYFNDDSLGFDHVDVSDLSNNGASESYYEVYINDNGHTFSKSIARKLLGTSRLVNSVQMYTFAQANGVSIVNVSPKIRGFANRNNAITFFIDSFDSTNSTFSAHISLWNGTTQSRKGEIQFGKVGLITRLYNDTSIDFIDVVINTDLTLSVGLPLDIQLFESIQFNDELLLLGSFNYDNTINTITTINNSRSFGLISVEDFNNKTLEYISNYDRLTRTNGIIRGFDLDLDIAEGQTDSSNPIQFKIKGGTAAINGKIIVVNDQVIKPKDIRVGSNVLKYWVCVNDKSEIQMIPMYDSQTTTANLYVSNVLTNSFTVFTFSLNDLIKRKDVVPLYLYNGKNGTTINNTGAFTLLDFRKYNDGIENQSGFKVSSLGYGGFRTFESIQNWAQHSTDLVHHIIVNDKVSISNFNLNNYLGTNTSAKIIIDGQGNGELDISNFTIIGRLQFQNIKLSLSYSSSSYIQGDVNFDNCDITILNTLSLNTASCKFTNCNITVNTTSNNYYSCNAIYAHNSAISMVDSQLFINVTTSGTAIYMAGYPLQGETSLNNRNAPFNLNSEFINNKIVYTSTVSNSGKLFLIQDNDFLVFKNNLIYGNFDPIEIDIASQSDNITITGNTFNTTYNPLGTYYYGSTIYSYVKNNINGGLIYIKHSGFNIKNLNISNNIFNYSPTSNITERFPFICLNSQATSVNISVKFDDNVFNTIGFTNNSTLPIYSATDHKAAIIISFKNFGGIIKPSGTVDNQPYQTAMPTFSLINGSISRNNCLQKQGIIVSHTSASTDYANSAFNTLYSNLLACGDLRIEDNNCGYIGTLLADMFPSRVNYSDVLNNNSNGIVTTRNYRLLIQGNNAHWVTHLTSEGTFLYPANITPIVNWNTNTQFDYNDSSGNGTSIANVITFDLCQTHIINNNLNWIHVINSKFNYYAKLAMLNDSTYTNGSDILIKDNELSAYSYTYLSLFRCQTFYWSDDTQIGGSAYPFISKLSSALEFLTKNSIKNGSPSHMYGASQAFAITIYTVSGSTDSVYGGGGGGGGATIPPTIHDVSDDNCIFNAIISGNIIRPQVNRDISVNSTQLDRYYYGFDYEQYLVSGNGVVGGGFINCQCPSIITDNQCYEFASSSPYMRVGLITVGDTAKIHNNYIGRSLKIGATKWGKTSGSNIWSYISVVGLFNQYAQHSYQLTQGYSKLGTNLDNTSTTPYIPGMITNNTFNSSTCVDGVWADSGYTYTDNGEFTVFKAAYIPDNWVVEYNKNQTNITVVDFVDGSPFLYLIGSGNSLNRFQYGLYYSINGRSVILSPSYNSGSSCFYEKTINLSALLPSGSTIKQYMFTATGSFPTTGGSNLDIKVSLEKQGCKITNFTNTTATIVRDTDPSTSFALADVTINHSNTSITKNTPVPNAYVVKNITSNSTEIEMFMRILINLYYDGTSVTYALSPIYIFWTY